MKTKPATLLSIITPEFSFERGRPQPFGATVERGGINFALYSSSAKAVTLAIFAPGEKQPIAEFPLDGRFNRTGNVWHAFLNGLDPGIEYGFRIESGLSTTENSGAATGGVLLDPYARGVLRYPNSQGTRNSTGSEWRGLIVDQSFDWGVDQPLDIALADTIIYELHVRGFTAHSSSKVSSPGTFAGLAEKIPYLQELGITAVELMPVTEFDESGNLRSDPITGQRLRNFWGYDPLGFFAPNGAYCSAPAATDRIREFKEMVKEFHAAGIEVILDVVFNHTGEGDASGPTVSFRGIDRDVYYMRDAVTGADRNYSGCGNTLNCNHPVVRDFILDCLRYWVTEMHIDGFRFDLASILGRGQDGTVLANPPLLERIGADPVLAGIKLIAEAWDAAGLYQVGSFASDGRWAEWNGRYRDDLRRYVRGDAGMVPALATRLAGSADLFQPGGRAPYHSINFITCHDGFTLADLVSYNEKNNERNGEENRDGSSQNLSWNCGVEGPSIDPQVEKLRLRQMKNLLALLLMSQGVPMILAGDERARSQWGNNNAYCQDNELGWILWEPTRFSVEQLHFVRKMVAFRRRHAALRSRSFIAKSDEPSVHIAWHGTRLEQPDWSHESRSLAMQLTGTEKGKAPDHLYLISNSYWEPLTFELPQIPNAHWTRIVDSAIDAPGDFTEGLRLQDSNRYLAEPRSVVILAGEPD